MRNICQETILMKYQFMAEHSTGNDSFTFEGILTKLNVNNGTMVIYIQ